MSLHAVLWTIVGILVPVLVGAGLTFIGYVPPEFGYARACFIGAACLLLSMQLYWAATTTHGLSARMMVSLPILLLIGVGLPEALQWVEQRQRKQTPEPSRTQDTAIFMESQMTPLPLVAEMGKSLRVIPLNRRRMAANNWGFYDVSGSQEDGKWPGTEVLAKSKELKNLGVFAYKCRLTNRGPQTIIYLGVPIDIWFGSEGGEANRKRYTAILSGLGPGDALDFYLVNDCNIQVSAAWQDTATVQILGEAGQRQVLLRRVFTSPIDQIMMFFPTSVRWIGGEPCE
jgi:hypothetical protein